MTKRIYFYTNIFIFFLIIGLLYLKILKVTGNSISKVSAFGPGGFCTTDCGSVDPLEFDDNGSRGCKPLARIIIDAWGEICDGGRELGRSIFLFSNIHCHSCSTPHTVTIYAPSPFPCIPEDPSIICTFQPSSIDVLIPANSSWNGGKVFTKVYFCTYLSPAVSPSITPSLTPPIDTPTLTPAPLVCNDICTLSTSDCPEGLECICPTGTSCSAGEGYCRNPICPENNDCVCPSPTPTFTPSPTPPAKCSCDSMVYSGTVAAGSTLTFTTYATADIPETTYVLHMIYHVEQDGTEILVSSPIPAIEEPSGSGRYYTNWDWTIPADWSGSTHFRIWAEIVCAYKQAYLPTNTYSKIAVLGVSTPYKRVSFLDILSRAFRSLFGLSSSTPTPTPTSMMAPIPTTSQSRIKPLGYSFIAPTDPSLKLGTFLPVCPTPYVLPGCKEVNIYMEKCD